MKYWIMKSEPSEYSIADLKRDKRGMWDGIRNYQVRNMLRDDMRVGDMALFYHSNAGKETGVVGVMKVVKNAYPDPTQFDPKSAHRDPKSPLDNPRWLAVDVSLVEVFSKLVSLSEIKSENFFADLALVRKGNRLSVMELSKKHFDRLCKMGK
ncbi:EVE domain-containing protein [Candidatus Kaiserbacteria bacterium]|nr:EVE domain-containing protein [Candidatus Kaiserbacteria bacterium]